MKLLFRCLLFALLVLTAGACRRHTIIPDDELALIFHDAFLVNARLNYEAKRDSLNVYEPIFARYGYTTADVQYTIGNFSKRKSARLGDVVELAIAQLEKEGKYYDHEVAILDTIDRVAERAATRRIREDSVIRVTTLKDTARLRIAFDAEPGSYSLQFDYLIDSLDRNSKLRYEVWLERTAGTRSNVASGTMWKGREDHFSRTFKTDTTHRTVHVDLGLFDGKPLAPSLTVSDLRIDYTPETAAAVDRLAEEQYQVQIFADAFIRLLLPEPPAEAEAAGESLSE